MMARYVAVACLALIPSALQASAATAFVFANERPAGEDKTRFLSTFAGSCSFSIRVLSDEGRVRQRAIALEVALRTALGSQLDGHRFTLNSYQVYFNNGARQRDVVGAVVAGSRGGTTTGSRVLTPLCSKDKTPDGWFDPFEISNNNPPFITEIEALFDDKPISVRSVFSPAVALSVPPTAFSSSARKNFADSTAGPQVDAAIDKANAALVARVAALLQ